MEEYRFCKKCNFQVPVNSTYCSKCGGKLSFDELESYDYLHPHPDEYIIDNVRRNRINRTLKELNKDNTNIITKARSIELNKSLKEAVSYFEEAILKGFKGKYPYSRLVVYYRSVKSYNDEIRVCNIACNNLSKDLIEDFKLRIEKVERLIMVENPVETSNSVLLKEFSTNELYDMVNNFYNDKLLIKEVNKLKDLLISSLSNTEDKNLKAKIYKLIGDMELNQNNKESALESYEKALVNNEKIGVKKIINKLKE